MPEQQREQRPRLSQGNNYGYLWHVGIQKPASSLFGIVSRPYHMLVLYKERFGFGFSEVAYGSVPSEFVCLETKVSRSHAIC